MSLHKDEVNLIILRYLIETGYESSAQSFISESKLTQTKNPLPLRALLEMLERGIKYTEGLFRTRECRQTSSARLIKPLSLIEAVVIKHHHDTETDPNRANNTLELVPKNNSPANNRTEPFVEIPPRATTFLKTPEYKMFQCAWNPGNDLLATGSADSLVRIWESNDNIVSNRSNSLVSEVISTKDMTHFEWNCDGTLLATSSSSGNVQIWNATSKTISNSWQFRFPILNLKWNKHFPNFFAVPVDKSVLIFNTNATKNSQEFTLHSAQVLDVDWQSDTTFASCSVDKVIRVCKVGATGPELIKTFEGHTDKVYSVRWSPQGSYLASCSADKTIKVWTTSQDQYVRNFEGHSKLISGIAWSKTFSTHEQGDGKSTRLILASGSYDSTVKLWDLERGVCKITFNKHTDAVCGLVCSPDGELIASCGFDKWIYIWSTQMEQLAYCYKSTGVVRSLSWNHRGDKLSGVVDNGSVFVLDLRYI